MKAALFTITLFAMSLVVSSLAQNEPPKVAPNNEQGEVYQTHINPVLVSVARATKYIYTHDAVFDFERQRPTSHLKDSATYEQHQKPPQAR